MLPVVEPSGSALPGTTVIGPRGARLTGRFAEAGGTPFRPNGLSVARRILDSALVDAAKGAGAEVREGMTVTALLYEEGEVGGAVVRNTVRRRLKAVCAEALPRVPEGTDVVIRALPASATATYAELSADVNRCLGRLAQVSR